MTTSREKPRALRREPTDWHTDTLHAARVGAVVCACLVLALVALMPREAENAARSAGYSQGD